MASHTTMYRKIRNHYSSSRLHFHKFSTRSCDFKGYKCPLPCIDGYYYCIKHILEDESAPFQQCSYVYPFSMKKCPLAAHRSEGQESYCPEHLCKLQRTRNRAGKSQPPLSTEKLLTSLSHFVPQKPVKRRRIDSESEEVDVEDISKPANPFVDVDANAVNNSLSNVLDYCSESDSDVDATIVGRTTRCNDEDSSDAESADSAGEDIFKFASVLTEEEALIRAKEKTARLKSLYSDQLLRLTHLLRERRRDFLFSTQKEKETNCAIVDQPKTTAREVLLAEKIRTYNNYRKHYGIGAVLRKKMMEKKGLILDNVQPRIGSKCVFTEGGVKCCVKTLPSSKYCPKHILEDSTQILFRACGFGNGDICKEPLPGMEPCVYHLEVPPIHLTYNTTLSSEDDEEDKNGIKVEEGMETVAVSDFPLDSLDLLDDDQIKLEVKHEEFTNGFIDDGTNLEIVETEQVVCEEEIIITEFTDDFS